MIDAAEKPQHPAFSQKRTRIPAINLFAKGAQVLRCQFLKTGKELAMSFLKSLIGTPIRTLSGLLAIVLFGDGVFDLWSGDYERALTALLFALFNGYVALFLLKQLPTGKPG